MHDNNFIGFKQPVVRDISRFLDFQTQRWLKLIKKWKPESRV